MRPRVLERLEKGSAASAQAARKASARQSAQRGPKNRPTYRVWEYATWRVRMRAWCNRIKSALLRDDHDPARPQTYRVLQSENCPIDNASTWLKWWAGDAIPRPTHIRAAERLVPGTSQLLEVSSFSTPSLRHLVALDIVNTRFRTAGRPSDHQRAQSQLLITALNEAWAPFLDARETKKGSRFALEAQLGVEDASLQHAVAVGEEQLNWYREGGNLLRMALPRAALLEYSWLEPLSIFRFLGMLATFNELENPALLQMWAYDLASAAMIFRTQLEHAAGKEMPVVRMGRAGVLYALAVNSFWAPRNPRLDPKVLDLLRPLFAEHSVLCHERLRAARSSYYAGFAALGIPERTVRALNADHYQKTWDTAFSIARARF